MQDCVVIEYETLWLNLLKSIKSHRAPVYSRTPAQAWHGVRLKCEVGRPTFICEGNLFNLKLRT